MENANAEDIKLLCDYRKDNLPVIEERSRALDFDVIKGLAISLLSQGIKAAEIVKGRTRLANLICEYVETESLVQGGKILPRSLNIDKNEQFWHSIPRSPTAQGSTIHSIPLSHSISSDSQDLIPFYQFAKTHSNAAKRRRVSGIEDLQGPTVCPIPTPKDNGSTTQAKSHHFPTDIPNHSEQQHNSPPSFEEAGGIEYGSLSSTSHAPSNGDLVPVLSEVEETQNRSMTHFGLYRDEPVVSQRLSVSRSSRRRSILNNTDTQQPSLVDDDLPPPTNSNADTDFTSYAIEFVHTLDDDARIAFGLNDNLEQS